MRLGLLAAFVAATATAQPLDIPPRAAALAACAEAWAISRAWSNSTAFEIADAAVDACPAGAKAATRLLEPDEMLSRYRAYVRARALIAVIDARLPSPPK